MTEEEQRFERLKSLLKLKDDKTIYKGGRIVPQDLAQDCINEYARIYEPAVDTKAMEFAYTEDVRFGVHGMLEWLIRITDSTDVDNIRVFNGIYTDDMATRYPEQIIYPGRVTVFLWPYHGNQKAVWKKKPGHGNGGDGQDTVGAFNLGNIEP